MFLIFHGDVLIGRPELEYGAPPMGVAFGRFEPTDAFAPLRNAMTPADDVAGERQRRLRYLTGLCAKTADGVRLIVRTLQFAKAVKPTIRLKCPASGSSTHFTMNCFRIM